MTISRTKGHDGERKLARILREAFPEFAAQIRRSIQSRGGGKEGADVAGLPGFHLEHKIGQRPNMRAAYEQAVADSQGNGYPMAVVQFDRARERLCVIGLTDMCRILRAAYGHTPPLKFGVQGELFEAVESEKETA